MLSALVLTPAGGSVGAPSRRKALSRRAAEAVLAAVRAIAAYRGEGGSGGGRHSVTKLPSGQPILKTSPGFHRKRTHISLSHLSDVVAGFAADSGS